MKTVAKEHLRREQELLKIYQGVFDDYTLKTLTTLASKNLFRTLEFPISTGKEADVYRVKTRDGTFLAAKIYRVETSNFKAMENYLYGDPRFDRIGGGKRRLISIWCQKEFRNLRDAYNAGVRVPFPVKNLNNVLLMEFIGSKEGEPAQTLKAVGTKRPAQLIKELAKFVKIMWTKAKIVHADLSDYNVLIYENKPYIIDIGQAVSFKHPMAKEFLERDLKNLKHMAESYGVDFNYLPLLNKLVNYHKD